jgi:hypothetical protein
MRDDGSIGRIIARLPRFFRYRNNNYREIFHLECIFFAILTEVAGAFGTTIERGNPTDIPASGSPKALPTHTSAAEAAFDLTEK